MVFLETLITSKQVILIKTSISVFTVKLTGLYIVSDCLKSICEPYLIVIAIIILTTSYMYLEYFEVSLHVS